MKQKLMYHLSFLFIVLFPTIVFVFAAACIRLIAMRPGDMLMTITLAIALLGIFAIIPFSIGAIIRYRKDLKISIEKKVPEKKKIENSSNNTSKDLKAA